MVKVGVKEEVRLLSGQSRIGTCILSPLGSILLYDRVNLTIWVNKYMGH